MYRRMLSRRGRPVGLSHSVDEQPYVLRKCGPMSAICRSTKNPDQTQLKPRMQTYQSNVFRSSFLALCLFLVLPDLSPRVGGWPPCSVESYEPVWSVSAFSAVERLTGRSRSRGGGGGGGVGAVKDRLEAASSVLVFFLLSFRVTPSSSWASSPFPFPRTASPCS